ncbi:MAG: hypothetical protein M3O70_11075 [Actinomycetota bacterium]|nr:hypothetical protein [Actinomycetota bacterium]
MKKLIVALVACGMLAVGATSAAAHTTSTPTSVRIVEQDVFEPPTHSVLGDLVPTAQKCRDNRRVSVYFDYAHQPIEWVLVDVARSGLSGSWAGSGFMNNQFGFVSSIRARVARKNIGPAGHRHICQGAGTLVSTGTG